MWYYFLLSGMSKIAKKLPFFILFLLYGCVSVKQPVITSISDFKLAGKGSEMKLKFDVLVKNPNNFGLTLQKLKVETFMGDSLVSSINTVKKHRIPANEVSRIEVTVEPKITLLPQLALSGISGILKKGSSNASLEGKLFVRKFIFLKKYSFRFPDKK